MLNKKTKIIFYSLIIFITLCFFFNSKITYAERNTNTAKIVIDASTKRVLYGENINEKMYMASTTKILTAITVIENCNIFDIINVTSETVGVEGSSIYLKDGDKYTVMDLLYGLMLRSGNDCAETLAKYCSGNIDNFVLLMNKTAKKIGANNSNFTNPHGLHNDNHYTTAYDLAIISSYAMENNVFRDIVSSKYHKITNLSNNKTTIIKNKNKMLFNFKDANGIKTGFTKNAGRCLVSSAKKNNMELISVVLNCGPMFEESESMLNNSFNSYKYVKVLDSKDILDFVKINNKICNIIIKKDVFLPLSENEKNDLIIKYNYNYDLNKDQNNENIGYVEFYIKNSLIFTEKLYTIE